MKFTKRTKQNKNHHSAVVFDLMTRLKKSSHFIFCPIKNIENRNEMENNVHNLCS